jgi:type IV secretion system protein VirB6
MATAPPFQANAVLSWLTGLVDSQVFTFTDQAISNGVAFLDGIIIWAAAIALALYFMAVGSGIVSYPVQGFFKKIGVVVLIMILGTQAEYTSIVRDGALKIMPDALMSLVTANTAVQFGAHVYDVLLNQALDAALTSFKGVFTLSFKIVWAPVEWTFIFAFMIMAGYSIAYGYGVWLKGHILSVIYVCIGFIFLPLFLFSGTKRMAEAWAGATISAIVLQALSVVLSLMSVGIEGQILKQIISSSSGIGLQLSLIIPAGIVFWYFGMVAKELPSIAAAMCGGVHFSGAQFANATYGTVISGAKMLGSGAVRGMSSMIDHARQGLRPPTAQTPPGPSLSRAPAFAVNSMGRS